MKVLISRLTNQGQEPQGPGRGLKFITRVTQEVQSSSHIYIENNFDNIFFLMKSMEATLCENNAQRNTHNFQFSHSITGISFGQIEARVTLFGDSFMIP